MKTTSGVGFSEKVTIPRLLSNSTDTIRNLYPSHHVITDENGDVMALVPIRDHDNIDITLVSRILKIKN